METYLKGISEFCCTVFTHVLILNVSFIQLLFCLSAVLHPHSSLFHLEHQAKPSIVELSQNHDTT